VSPANVALRAASRNGRDFPGATEQARPSLTGHRRCWLRGHDRNVLEPAPPI